MSIELLTIPEIAEMLKLSPRHVNERIVNNYNFPSPTMIGRTRRWFKTDVNQWILSQRIKPTGRPRNA